MRPGNPKVEDIEGFAALLKRAGVDFGAEDVADALWLAGHMGEMVETTTEAASQPTKGTGSRVREEVIENEDDEAETLPLSLPSPAASGQTAGTAASESGIPIKAPAAPALRIRLDLARALRPLRRKVPSPERLEFDEEATVEQIADQQIWSPVLKPAPERWLDLALVVEDMASLPLWEETIAELQTVVERQGAFRRVTTWRLGIDDAGNAELFANWRQPTGQRPPLRSQRLWDATGRRLILLLSDCTSAAWRYGSILRWLKTCNEQAPTAVIQLFPEDLWGQTGLGQGRSVWLRALEPGTVTAKLKWQYRRQMLQQLLALADQKPTDTVTIPVVTLAAEPMKQWAKVVAGGGESRAIGVQFDLDQLAGSGSQEDAPAQDGNVSAEVRVQQFRATASLMAQQLAGLMAAAPVSPPIVNLIRQTLLPQAEPVHVAEVFMGGLMAVQPQPEADEENAALPQYDFAPGVRQQLAQGVAKSATESVLDAVSRYIADRLGLSTKNFEALLRLDFRGDAEAQDLVIPFAEIAVETLERMGGEYAAIAAQVTTGTKVQPPPAPPEPGDLFPLLQTFKFREATLTFAPQPSESLLETPEVALEAYGFTTREAQIWRLRQQGLGAGEIAARMSITVSTVRRHLGNIQRKRQFVDTVVSLGLRPELIDIEMATITRDESQAGEENFETVLSTLEEHLESQRPRQRFGLVQKDILRRVWDGQSYKEIANATRKNPTTVRKQGIQLWQMLSQALGETVTKTNARQVLTRWSAQDRSAAPAEWVIRRSPRSVWQCVEALGGDVDLAMVMVPQGAVMVGSLETEEGRRSSESPRHQVTLAEPFLMAKYPITQAQWRAVAAMPQVERELDPDPAKYKGDNRPVEQVSWHDAVEFCARLSRQTGRDYRLPSEAEWEYACRAGTTTPFHFGETIAPELANYRATVTFSGGPKGEYREQTTDVGSFPANAFGLYDLHGNVLEWCQDWWHDSYEGAPEDGSAWLTHAEDAEEERVLRGGSWNLNPGYCRSANRFRSAPDDLNDGVGFRVVCGVAR